MEITTRNHPEYAFYKPEWDFFLQTYQGGQPYIDANLIQDVSESDESFGKRKLRAYRENYSATLVDIVNSYLFKEPVNRKLPDDKLNDFFENIDGQGGDIDRFMQRASIFSSVMGRVYIAIDKPALAEEEKTNTRLDTLRTQPYAYIIFPQNMQDVAFNKDGTVKWAITQEFERNDDDPFFSDGDVEKRYRVWVAGAWHLYDEKGALLDSGETNMSRVPIVPLDTGEKLDAYNSPGLLYDIARLDRSIFNNYSRLDSIVNDQTFSQLIFPIQSLPMSEIMEDANLRRQYLSLATNRVFFYDASSEASPEYISPDASQAQFILDLIKHQIRQLFGSLGMKADTAEGLTPQSGVSKAYDFDKLNKLLSSKARNLEVVEYEIVRLFEEWNETTVLDEFETHYPEEFDIRSLSDEVILTQELALLNISKTFNTEVEKNLAHKALPRANKDKMDEINKEIEDKYKNLSEEDEVFDFDNQKQSAKDKSNEMTQTKYQLEKKFS